MTPEQLDEIEKLAEAATPGPWRAQLSDKGHALWGPLPNGECGSMRIALSSYAAFDRANMLFMEALRDAALPLVKAVREARVERDEAFRERADWIHSLDRSKGDIITLMRERDEARAEVERLREAIRGALTNGHMNALCWAQNDDECIGRCRVLRDALGEGER